MLKTESHTYRTDCETCISDCFATFVRTKIVKKLVPFSVRHAPSDVGRKLLLPVSLGPSSLCLLYVLDEHLKRQLARTKRTGYELHVLHVTDPSETSTEPVETSMNALKELFPQHAYDIKCLESPNWSMDIPSDDSVHAEQPMSEPYWPRTSPNGILNGIVDTSLSPTSRTDILEIARTRLIVEEAQRLGCECVLWAHSTTKIAEKVLAETAKGRGFALPWLAHDGPSPFGIDFLFPMRDLLKKEVNAFSEQLLGGIKHICRSVDDARIPISSKAKTIDGLMQEYFESVEESYPSIVTNVMRTSGKLAAPSNDERIPCRLCRTPVSKDAQGTSNWAGVQEASQSLPSSTLMKSTCYGCATTLLDQRKSGG